MAKGFNFQAKMGLDTKNFKKGVNQLKASLNSLKSMFTNFAGTLGVGFGLKIFTDNLRDTALRLDTAMNTLKNASTITKRFKTDTGEVSVELNKYAENLQFVKDLSSKYGQDLISLTDNYAKFIAASKGTNISLEDQKFVFEALTRAAAAYHLSADRTSDMMNAVVQMMSKGKVAAEELRRQLGNTLPGAFNIMAASMGVSTKKLDDMMKNGEVIASEVLPKFAKQLNLITANANFDSMQNSLNKLSNEWYNLVEKTNFDNFYKGIVDFGTKGLKYVTKNFKSIGNGLLYGLTALFATPKLGKAGMGIFNYFKGYRERLTNEILEIDKEIEKIRKKYGADGLSGFFSFMGNRFDHNTETGELNKSSLEDLELQKKHNELLYKKFDLLEKLGIKSKENFKDEYNALKTNDNTLKSVIKQTKEFQDKIQPKIGPWNKIEFAIKGIGKSLYAILGPIGLITAGLTIISSIVGVIIGNIKDMIYDLKKLDDIRFSLDDDFEKALEPSKELSNKINTLFESFKSAENIEVKKSIFNQLKELLPFLSDVSFDNFIKGSKNIDKLSTSIANNNEQLQKQAELQFLLQDLENSKTGLKTAEDKVKAFEEKGDTAMYNIKSFVGDDNSFVQYKKLTDYGKAVKEVENYTIRIDNLNKKLKDLKLEELPDSFNKGPWYEDTSIGEVFNNNIDKLKKLSNAYKEGAISVDKYHESLNELYTKDFEDAAETGLLSVEKIKKKLDEGKTLDAIEKWYIDLSERAAQAIVFTSLDKVIKELEKKLDDTSKKFDEQLALTTKVAMGEYEPEKVASRNKSMDYKKTLGQRAGEELDIVNQKISNTENSIKELQSEMQKAFEGEINNGIQAQIDKLQAELIILKQQAQDFESVMNFAEMEQDLKDFNKNINSLNESLMDSTLNIGSNFVTSIDNIIGSFERLNSVMSDNSSSGWERFVAIFEVFENTLMSIMNTMKTFNEVSLLSAELKNAEYQKQLLLNQATQQGIALEGTALAVKESLAAASATAAAGSLKEAAAASVNTSAKSKEAIATGVANAAKLPIPLSLVAISSTIAAIVAALGALQKFEKGGIVQGSTTGDKNLIRANGGEMILNKHQQSTLWSMLNGKSNINGNVNFKIKGADLVGTIENYKNKIKG